MTSSYHIEQHRIMGTSLLSSPLFQVSNPSDVRLSPAPSPGEGAVCAPATRQPLCHTTDLNTLACAFVPLFQMPLLPGNLFRKLSQASPHPNRGKESTSVSPPPPNLQSFPSPWYSTSKLSLTDYWPGALSSCFLQSDQSYVASISVPQCPVQGLAIAGAQRSVSTAPPSDPTLLSLRRKH